MPDTTTLITFSIAAMVLFVIPGPAVLYIITRSIIGGRRAGLVSVAGIHMGTLVHVAAAVAGLSTLLAASATAFHAVKWAGAAYLIFLGTRAYLARAEADAAIRPMEQAPLGKVFRQGFVVNALNPKTALFFLAFVPQFIDPTHSGVGQILVLSGLFIVLGLISDGLYATGFGSIGTRLTQTQWWRTGRWALPTTMYIGLGVFAALAGTDPSDSA